MKKMQNKCWIILASLSLVMVMAATGIAGPGPKGGHGHDPMDRVSMKERVLSKLDYSMQELELTAAQQAEYAAIRKKMAASMEEAAALRHKLHEAVRAEMQKEHPDVRTLAKTMKQEVSVMPDDISFQIDAMLKVYEMLDKSQQDRFVKMVKEHMPPMDGPRDMKPGQERMPMPPNMPHNGDMGPGGMDD